MIATVRRAQKQDSKPVGALWLRLLDEHAAIEPRFGVADDALERWTNDFAHWVDDEQYRVFVAELESEVVGFVTAALWKPLPIYTQAEEVYINELYVTTAVRAQGIGRRLIDAVRTWAETIQAERLRVGVLAANAEGRAFWERLDAQPFLQTLTIALEKQAIPATEKKKKARLGF